MRTKSVNYIEFLEKSGSFLEVTKTIEYKLGIPCHDGGLPWNKMSIEEADLRDRERIKLVSRSLIFELLDPPLATNLLLSCLVTQVNLFHFSSPEANLN